MILRSLSRAPRSGFYLHYNQSRCVSRETPEKERDSARRGQVPWGVVPNEVGAPARGMDSTTGTIALTPRIENLTPVRGPGISRHGLAILSLQGRWSRWPT